MEETASKPSAGHPDPLDDPEEREVLYSALNSFRLYRQQAHYNVTHLRRQSFYSLPSTHIDILSSSDLDLPGLFRVVDDCIDRNAEIAEAIVDAGLIIFGIDPNDESWHKDCAPLDLDKARSTIRQIYRDWSAAGSSEREAAYAPLVSILNGFQVNQIPSQRSRYKVLVPGAGLGRLCFDLVKEGYYVEGNEISYHQALASNYLLNFTHSAGQHELYPWALNFSNHRGREDQLQGYPIPDIHPGAVLETASDETKPESHYSERMSMGSGDFCVTYRRPEYRHVFDAVVTCFFIDTAPNLINYIEAVRNCLKPSGHWINLGPLLWHFESAPTLAERERQDKEKAHPDRTSPHAGRGISAHAGNAREDHGIGEPGSYELSNREVLTLLIRFGFIVEWQDAAPATGYIQNPNSMLQNTYLPTCWVAVKKELRDA